jgi:enterochelin esterase family protein
LLAFACVSMTAAQQPASPGQTPSFELAQSPRLAALQKEVERGNRDAVAAFWKEMADKGTPLVESIEGDDQHVIATFLWRGKPDTKGVLAAIPFRSSRSLLENMMTQMPGTDLWYRTLKIRSDLRFTYTFLPDPMAAAAAGLGLSDLVRLQQFDPLNPKAFHMPPDPEDPDANRLEGSIAEMPKAAPQPWIVKQSGVPEGKVDMQRFKSVILGNQRRIWIYTPPRYSPTAKEPYRVLICFDGRAYLDSSSIPTPTILDNLLAKGRIPPIVAVLVENPWASRKTELANYQPFADFLGKELVPWVRQRYHVSTDPSKAIVCGLSAGGLTAGYVAFKRRDLFGNVLAQSGAFWRGNEGDEVNHEWLKQQFEASPVLPIHFYIEGGVLETSPSPNNGPTLPVSAQHLRDVLKAKGYPVVEYREIPGSHEPLSWRGTLSDGLLFLLQNEAKGGKTGTR